MGDEEGSGSSSVATSSPTPLINWWDLHATSLSCWSNQPNPDSHSSSCEDDISASNSTSFTNASNHSTLTAVDVDDAPRRLLHHHHLPPAPDTTHLWTHVLLSNEELENSQQVGENFVDALSSKSMNMTSSMMFEPACDYLKKLDSSWEYNSNSNISDCATHVTSFEKHLNGGFSEAMLETDTTETETERFSELSNLVSTWSIAPPHPQLNNNNHNHTHFVPQTNTTTLNNSSSMDHSGIFPSYGGALDMKVKHEHNHHHLLLHDASKVPGGLFGRSSCNNYNDSTSIGYQNGSVGDNINGKFYYGMPTALSSCTRNLSDVISFAGRLGRPVIGIHALKPTLKSLNVSDSKKQGFQTSSGLRSSNGRGQGSSTEAKKKRTDESSEAMLKKPKQETSTASSTKVQAPKVKLGDRITTLQQIVSPFGKTDTASVLFEAIGCIKFLQEQIQLLSNSYMKTNSHKDAWGSLDRKENGDMKVDLRSRGLCLVPISCTPQLYRDDTGPDYWTPAYRGCLYR